MNGKKWQWIIIATLAIVVRIIASFPAFVEKYYSTGLYPVVSRVLRIVFGWLPFSVGDLVYLAAGIFLLIKLIRFFKVILTGKAVKIFWWNAVRELVFYCLLVYTIFNIFWGLNYNRLGMAYQMHLQVQPYTTEDLTLVVTTLLQRLDSATSKALPIRNVFLQKDSLFAEAERSYRLSVSPYPQLLYKYNSVKPTLYNKLGDYLGFTGYYNPFTGEAQVNTSVPVFVRPFTTCHEMGHQLGYAKENEANFAGYLSAKSSHNIAFQYAVYFDLYSYGIRELYLRDSALALALNKRTPPQIKKDITELKNFYNRYENPFEPYIRKLYGQYLKANEQPSGMNSYNEVMAFLIAYFKKYGAAAL